MRTFGWSPTESELQVSICLVRFKLYPFLSPSNIQELISEIDQDGNGEISFNEFVWLMTRSKKFIFLKFLFYSVKESFMMMRSRMRLERHFVVLIEMDTVSSLYQVEEVSFIIFSKTKLQTCHEFFKLLGTNCLRMRRRLVFA